MVIGPSNKKCACGVVPITGSLVPTDKRGCTALPIAFDRCSRFSNDNNNADSLNIQMINRRKSVCSRIDNLLIALLSSILASLCICLSTEPVMAFWCFSPGSWFLYPRYSWHVGCREAVPDHLFASKLFGVFVRTRHVTYLAR